MKGFLNKRWVWVVALFLVINIAGLVKIISLLERAQGQTPGITSFFNSTVRNFPWVFNKAAKDIIEASTSETELKVEEISPAMQEMTPSIYIRLSEDIDLNKIDGYIEVTPKVDFYADYYYSGITLNGNFIPRQAYTVEILKGMPSAAGKTLKESIKKEVVIPDYDPCFKLKIPGIYMSLNGNQIIPLEATNIDKLKVKVHRVYDNNIVYLLNNMGQYSFPSDVGIDVVETEIKTKCEFNKPKELYVDLKEVLAGNSHGLFFIEIENPDSESFWNRESRLILTSDMGILAKKSNSDLFVWLNSLSSANAVSGATVKIFSKTNQQLLEGITDAGGMVHFEDVDWKGDRAPFVVTAATEDDLSFVELDKCTLAETTFDVEGRPFLSSGYEAFTYTDRGIYRPGETAHIKAVVRGIGAELSDSFPIIFEIVRPDEREFKKFNGMLSKFGTAETDVAIPGHALTGKYQVNILLPGVKEPIGTCAFNVEEFMPDRLKVSVSAQEKRFKLSDDISLTVKAEHFFGAPAANRLIEVSADLKPLEFKVEGFKDYTFTDPTKKFSHEPIRLEEKQSDENGLAAFELKLPSGLLPPSSLGCSIEAIVKEIGGRAVASYTERTIDPYSYYIGIRQSAEGYASINEKTNFQYVTVSPDGKKIESPELEVSVCKIIWNTLLKKDEKGEYRYITEDKEECVLKETIKREDATGVFAFTPSSWGDYIIRIKGAEEGSHVASLKFYCSEAGYMPWAMDRPDRIELTLDKKSYKPGDKANLVVKSPFKGRALLTISQDTILSTRVVELTSPTQEISIDVLDDFSPNVYCAVTVIRPITQAEDWSSHRAYGIVPLVVDSSAHKLNVKLIAPTKATPKESVTVDVDVTTSFGTPAEAEVSLALVDEGILRLTDFKTPDPLEFFYGKRGSYIQTSDIYSFLIPEIDKNKIGADSTPSADSSYDPKGRLNPISAQRVKPVALWQGSITTDNTGKAKATFTIPEFIGNLKVMVVGVEAKSFGSAEEDLKVTEPVMITPTLPRFLSVGDEFTVPVIVLNTTGKDGNVTVVMEASEGFSVVGDKSYTIEAKDKKEALVNFTVISPNLPQKGEITIKATLGGYTASRTTELAVRPPAPLTTLSGAGVLQAPGNASINVAGNWLKGTEKYLLTVSSLPGIEFLGALKFLVQYPYGCIEQTTSSVFPLLYLKDIAAVTDPNRFSAGATDSYINEGINRVFSMQTYSGGFSLWQGYNTPDKWGSVYATDFLIEAEKAGYNVPKQDKDAALNYLETILAGRTEENPLEIKAYACYVLAKADHIKASWIRKLQEEKNNMPGYARFYLAASLMLLNDKNAVMTILGEGVPDEKIERKTGGDLDSYAKTNGLALSIYMDIDPENKAVPVLVKRLKSSMQNGSWGTTQDNAAALLGLGKYARYIESHESDYTGSVTIDKKIVTEFDSAKMAQIKDVDLGGKEIELLVKGKGNAYYCWSSEGVPISGKIEEKDKGIKIRRSFFTREGQSFDLTKIKQGDTVIADISIQAEQAYKNVIVEDLLPACFEIENPRIATTEKVEWMTKDNFEPDHIDIRDDRLLLFTDLPSTDTIHYRYVVRAVTKGKFALPAVSASCMYDPSITSASGQGSIEVK